MELTETHYVDVDAIIRERFQQYFGLAEDLPLASQVIVDLGVDSIVFVTILMDLFVQLNLDLGDARVKLGDIRTLGDVASLVRSLREGELATVS
jgi:acyl carrier protein